MSKLRAILRHVIHWPRSTKRPHSRSQFSPFPLDCDCYVLGTRDFSREAYLVESLCSWLAASAPDWLRANLCDAPEELFVSRDVDSKQKLVNCEDVRVGGN
ncbi:hypothetical protein PV328_007759 [Microctonus aethiopoides]|uniref:Uncharacterized protein n=1 Tax=Microctonus aethiopoides TaxID=144406 RepID=A0AA39F0U5_9HYME|nr:hypothetical protein PV328_007759 [Microctonus aethiopoides]